MHIYVHAGIVGVPRGSKVSDEPLLKQFQDIDYDDMWDRCSDLVSAVRYARASVLLQIPDEWRPHLPTEM